MKKKKYIKIVLSCFILVFVIFNLLWFYNYNLYSSKITNLYEKAKGGSFFKDDNSCTYTVKRPNYLSFVGNYGINSSLNKVEIIIWPSFGMKKYEYGARIEDDKQHVYEMYINDTGEIVNIDEFDYTKEEEKIVKKLVSDNKSEIKKMIGFADKEWHIL